MLSFQLYPSNNWGTVKLRQRQYPVSLPVRFGGLEIPLFHNDPKYEYENSRKLTSSLTQLVKDRYQIFSVNEVELK